MPTDRLRFETILLELSTSLVGVPAVGIDEKIARALERTVALLDVDIATLWEVNEERTAFRITHRGHRAGITVGLPSIDPSEFAWLAGRTLGADLTWVRRLDDLPAEAAGDRVAFERRGARSAVVCPLLGEGSVTGAISVVSIGRECDWSESVGERLRIVGQMFAGALASKRSAEHLQEEKEFAEAVIESLPGLFFVLDEESRLVRWNRNREIVTGYSADELRGQHLHKFINPEYRAQADRVVELALGGRDASLEHEVPTKDGRRIPHVASGRRATIGGRTYVIGMGVDISALRAAQEQMRRQQAELAHVARVSAMGELVAAIAHEINQPLAAIRTNAQAGRRMLASGRVDAAELTEAFGDIARDAVRADEIIRRLRDLVQKGEVERVPLQVNDLVRDIEPFVRADAREHGVLLVMDLATGLPCMLGDRIQLQQVLLNLVRNAVDAMHAMNAGATVVVRTNAGPGAIEVAVSDAGPPLDDEAFARLFQPFHTTKPTGLGIGLSLSRTIVEAHGGSLRATRNPDRGITMQFTLPCEPAAR